MKSRLKKIFNYYLSKFGWQAVHFEDDDLYQNCINKIHSLVIANSNLTSAYYFLDLSRELILREIIKNFSIDYIIDIGANEGQFYKSIRSSGYSSKGISFEPTARSFDKLKMVTEKDPDWQVFSCALGDRNQNSFINIYEESVFNSFNEVNSCGENLFSDMVRPTAKQEVEIVTLDSFISENALDFNHKNIFIKTDTQGYDLKILKGAKHLLSSTRVIQVELAYNLIYQNSPQSNEIVAFLNEQGFHLTAIIPISIDPKDFRLIECDGIFSRHIK
jgi:FkbM family methyltransferase